MRVSHIALLSLAASTTAPVFAAPLPYFNARSEDGGAALGARDSHDGCTSSGSTPEKLEPQSHSDNSNDIFNRNSMDDFITAIANMNTGGSDVKQEAHARDSSDNAFGVVERNVPSHPVTENELLSAMLTNRDLNSGQDRQARSFFSNVIKAIEGGFLRRDVTPELLGARNVAEDLVNSIIGSRDSNPNNGFAKVLNALKSSRRDVTSDELAARDDWEDLVKMLNTRELGFKRDMQARGPSLLTSFLAWLVHKLMFLPIRHRDLIPDGLAGRDAVDDFLYTYMSNHATRELSPQQETQARGIADGPAKTVARDDSSTDAFIKALLSSRDSSKRLTADDVLSLASLASRTLDELN